MRHNTRGVLLVGLFIAFEIILTRFFSIENSILRISFELIPIAISAIMLGPITAGVAAAVADVLGMFIFPKGAYFPGFTLSAFISGYLYGIFLYKKKVTILKVFLASLSVILVVELLLKTVWLTIITQNAAMAMLPARLIKSAVFLPIISLSVYLVWKSLAPVFRRFSHIDIL